MHQPQAYPTLEERIRAIEDRLEILNLIAGHPPSADTGADYYTRAVYAEGGVFDRGPHLGGAGREAIAAGVKTAAHQAAISGGLAHFCGLPHIELDGDRAAVTSYLQILMPDPNGRRWTYRTTARRRVFASFGSPPTAGSSCAAVRVRRLRAGAADSAAGIEGVPGNRVTPLVMAELVSAIHVLSADTPSVRRCPR